MGYNTSMIIRNDALTDIERDPEFGKKVSRAVSDLTLPPPSHRSAHGVDVSAGSSVNAATVIESHHADSTSVVAFGQNRAIHLMTGYVCSKGESEEVRILKELADKLGYHVRRKPPSGE